MTAPAWPGSRGTHAKYLNDGLLGLAELLRGDKARDFVKATAPFAQETS